jgi:tetratricopeptide (TPR) repeat protein
VGGGVVVGANSALRVLVEEARLSNAGLARAVVAAGAEEGVHVGTNTTSVRRMLDGCQPRWPVPRLVAKVLSRALHHEISVTECGFVDRTPASDDQYDGLHCSGTLDGTLRTVVELSGRDMRRRKFLVGSAFNAAAFSESVLFALTVPPLESTARAGGRRVGMADVEILTEQVTHLHRLEHRYGSGRVREQAVQLLHREASIVLHGSYTEKTGKALLGAVAQASWLAAGMAADVGRHSLAQRYDIQALDLAMAAGDRRYAAYVLACMSRFTVQIGYGAVSEYHRLRNARQSVALARAGRELAGGTATPALGALLHAVEARGHALLGDANATRRAVHEAERQYERCRPDDEPPWMGFFTPAELAADLGRCLRDTGESDQAAKLITQAHDSYEPWRVRSRCFVQTDLAAAHLVGRDFEQAAALGRDAVRTAAQVSSTRTLDRLRTLQRQARPLRASSPHLRELDDRITDFLTRRSARPD